MMLSRARFLSSARATNQGAHAVSLAANMASLDLKSYSRWYDYSRARDAMFAASDTAWAPWFVARADDKMRARLNIITHLLSQLPYTSLSAREVVLPKRQRKSKELEAQAAPPVREIPTPY